jgi:hypothetical protein
VSLILLRAASIPVSGKTPSVDNKMHFYEQFVDPLRGGVVGNMREVLVLPDSDPGSLAVLAIDAED